MIAAPPKKSALKLMEILAGTYVRPYARTIGIALVFMIVEAAMTASLALLLEPVLDKVLASSGSGGARRRGGGLAVPFFAGLVLATFALRGLSNYAHTILMNKASQSVIGDIQKDLFSHFMGMDMAFFHANPSGQLISRIVNDVNVMRLMVTETMTGFGKSLFTLVFLVAVMLFKDWKLSLVALFVFPFAVFFVARVGVRLRKVSGRIQSETGILSARLLQIFQGIRQVKAFGMEAHEIKQAGEAIDTVRGLNVKSVRIATMSTPVNEILVGMIFCGIIVYGGHGVAEGRMTTGQLVSFIAAFTLAYEPMKKLAKLNNMLQTGLGAAERVMGMMDIRPTIAERPGAGVLSVRNPEITFSDVRFHYESAETKALDGITFTARAGAVTALVGPSGGGKSTIINLIPRFYDVHGGAVRIDGRDVRDVTTESLRKHIALVSQDITIFDDTAEANIAYGSPGAGPEDIIRAAKAADAHGFIEGLAQGYQTRLGESGVKLSGGQRQRIAIARAILRDAPILLLDEATSALDNESEKAVQGALRELEKGRTTIVIAHRLSTVQSADRIIVLDKGRIAEQGRHGELLAQGGLYAKMHRAGFQE